MKNSALFGPKLKLFFIFLFLYSDLLVASVLSDRGSLMFSEVRLTEESSLASQGSALFTHSKTALC